MVALLRRLCGRAALGAAAAETRATAPELPAGLAERAESAGLDLGGALQRLGGKTDLFARMAQSFAGSAGGLATELRVLSPQEGAVALHGFKGVAGTIGARSLAELARQGEQMLRQGGELEPAWVDDLERQIDVGCRALLQVADALAPKEGAAGSAALLDVAAARQDLQVLIELLGNSDLGALDTLEELRRRHGSALDRTCFEALDNAMAQLDFDAAARHCQDLLDTLA
jgi:two-component system sensor histidine kinase/response regulator